MVLGDIVTFLVGVYIAGILIYVAIKAFFGISPPREEKKGKTKFFEWLDKKFDLAFVNDKSDIEMLKSAFEREVSTVYSLAPLLEDYLVYLGERGICRHSRRGASHANCNA